MNSELDVIKAWEDYWLLDKNQGLTNAIPWAMQKVRNIKLQYCILYVAWNHDTGLLHQYVNWQASQGKPKVDPQAWSNGIPPLHSDEPKWDTLRHIPHGERTSSWNNIASKLTEQLRANFTQGLKSEQISAYNQPFNQSDDSMMQLKMIAYLLGNHPTEGYSISECAKRRTQFVNAYPILASMILQREEFVEIDSGVETIPYLANHFHCSETLIRFAAKIKMNPDKSYHHNSGWIKRKFFSDIKQWNALSVSIPKEDFFKLCDVPNNNTHECVISTLFNNYTIRRKPEILQALNINPDELLEMKYTVFLHLRDVVLGFSREIILPYLRRYGFKDVDYQTRQCSETAFLYLGLNRLYRALSIHLENRVHSAVFGKAAAAQAEWPLLAEPVIAPNGLTLRFLTSQSELNWEGKLQKNCVASYGTDCKRGYCAILSIGEWLDNEWIPSSTVEIRSFDNLAHIEQHEGYNNTSPESASVEALEWWQENKQSELDISKLKNDRETSEVLDLENLLGVEWASNQAFEYRWDRWQRILGTKHPDPIQWLIDISDKMTGTEKQDIEDLILKLEDACNLPACYGEGTGVTAKFI